MVFSFSSCFAGSYGFVRDNSAFKFVGAYNFPTFASRFGGRVCVKRIKMQVEMRVRKEIGISLYRVEKAQQIKEIKFDKKA